MKLTPTTPGTCEPQTARVRQNSTLRRQAVVAFAEHKQRTDPINGEQGAWSPCSWLVLLLALSIFAWGTSYKLSLFTGSQPGGVPPAKLCKLTSDNAKSQVDHAVEGHTVALSSVSADTGSTLRENVFVLHEQVARSGGIESLAPLRSAPVLHLRPPPSSDEPMFL